MGAVSDIDALRALVTEIEAARGTLSALLFDLDGTLVDTMALHWKAYQHVFAEMDRDFPQQLYMDIVGPPAKIIIPIFLEKMGLPASDIDAREIHARKKAAFADILETHAPIELPALTLLRERARTTAIAIVTSGNRHGTAAIMRALHIENAVDAIVTAEDVNAGKPNPEPFARALRALNAAPGHALAFEDNPVGMTSAMAAGLDVIDVRDGTLLQASDHA